eukprot:Pgem_evm1s6401
MNKITNKICNAKNKNKTSPTPRRRREAYVKNGPLGFEDLREKKKIENQNKQTQQRPQRPGTQPNKNTLPTYINPAEATTARAARGRSFNNNNARANSLTYPSVDQSCSISTYSAPAQLESPPPPPPSLQWYGFDVLECVYSFDDYKTGDLKLESGDRVYVIKEEESGWCYGRNNRTGLA